MTNIYASEKFKVATSNGLGDTITTLERHLLKEKAGIKMHKGCTGYVVSVLIVIPQMFVSVYFSHWRNFLISVTYVNHHAGTC